MSTFIKISYPTTVQRVEPLVKPLDSGAFGTTPTARGDKFKLGYNLSNQATTEPKSQLYDYTRRPHVASSEGIYFRKKSFIVSEHFFY